METKIEGRVELEQTGDRAMRERIASEDSSIDEGCRSLDAALEGLAGVASELAERLRPVLLDEGAEGADILGRAREERPRSRVGVYLDNRVDQFRGVENDLRVLLSRLDV